ncbi:MAG: M48 family metallopeptidase [Bacteroidota bacterium]
MSQTLFIIILCIVTFNYLFGLLLDYLDITLWSNTLPNELQGIYDADKYRKSQDYEKTNTRFSFLTGAISFVAMLCMLVFGGFAWLDDSVRNFTTNPILMALMFFGILGLASDILGMPFEIYDTFVIEQKFGFNTTKPITYITDKLKTWLMAIVLGGGLLAFIIWIYGATGSWFWFVAWVALTGFTLFMSLFYSNLIVPLFNKQKPLEEGPLRLAIEEFAAKTGFKLKNIFVIDGSKRSRKANAYFTGFGPKKRIVLYDTLINDLSTEEIVAVLAHETGHYKKKHVIVGLLSSILSSGLILYILSLFIGNPAMSMALGATLGSFHMGIIAFALLYSPISMVFGMAGNYFSRRNEYAADRYAAQNYQPEAMQSGLKKLSVMNLSNLRPHPLRVFLSYSHPTLLQRLNAIDLLKNK